MKVKFIILFISDNNLISLKKFNIEYTNICICMEYIFIRVKKNINLFYKLKIIVDNKYTIRNAMVSNWMQKL